MIPTSAQLAELKQIETEMLRAFVEVCGKLHLRYYLLGGTLLGAVRHKGFIPWDDDIDVGMPREDYEVFLEKGQALLPSHLFIQSLRTEPAYTMCFAKLRNSNTTFVESSLAHFPINHGVYIDIFPLDFYPSDSDAQKRFSFKQRWYARRVGCEYNVAHNRTCKGKVRKLILCMLFPSLMRTIAKREALYRSVPESSLLANLGGAWGQKEIVPAHWYGDGVPVEFEGMQVCAPVEWHSWLTQVYGDYMKLPPVEKRVGHHYVDMIDLHTPYTNYTEKQK